MLKFWWLLSRCAASKLIWYLPAIRKIDWLNEPFVCRMPTCAPSGALGLRAVKPLPLPEIPDLPVNVQMVPVGSYWNVPAPREGASKPASPKVCVPPMPKGELKTEAEEKSKSAVAVMFAPPASAVESVKLNLALPLPSVVTVVCPMNVRPW